jgi:cardiolipin synthase
VDATPSSSPQWFTTGDAVFPAMLAAIDGAVASVSLETYIFADCQLGERFRAALVAAAQRGVRVRVLVDAFGSLELPDYFWHPLQSAGGEVRLFNPIALGRLGIRDHRKLLACDGRVAFIGGFNVAREYEGDGVSRGWCDLGVRVTGALAVQLEASFERLFQRADLRHKPFVRLRKTAEKRRLVGGTEELLLSGPGRGASPLLRALRRDLGRTDAVRIVVAYFLPTWRLRRDLQKIARCGGRVQLLLAGKSDVLLSRLAARSLYRKMLRAGVEIYEYEPQVLHAKMFIVGPAVYAGSANLDPRSLHLNYELMVRFESDSVSARAGEIFDALLARSRRIERGTWRKSRTWLARWQERVANFLLARVDPYLSLRQWQSLPD